MKAQDQIPIELIPAFLVLAEELNISRAARRLNLSQPALTRKLKNLESHLGVQLFLRQSRGLAPTSKAKELKQSLTPAFAIINAAFLDMKNSQQDLQGQIVFGCFSEIGTNLIVPALISFSRLHPQVSFDVRYLSEYEIISGIADGTIHIGIANKAPHQDGIRSYKLLSENIQLFTSPNNPDVEKNQNPRFVGYKTQDRLLKELLKTIFPSNVSKSLQVTFSVNSHAAMIAAVRELNLYGALPHHSLQSALKNAEIRLASPKKLLNEVHLIVPSSDFPEKKISELVKFLRNQLQATGVRKT